MEEAQIIALLLAQDPMGMDAFLKRYAPLMRYILAPILPDKREQEECIADIALRVWSGASSFDSGKGSFTTWLTVLSRNATLNRARSHNRILEISLEDAPTPSCPGPEELLLEKERRNRLQQILLTLKQSDRILLYRKYYYLQSSAQIARELGTTERAVEGRLYRLKKRLKKKLGGELYD